MIIGRAGGSSSWCPKIYFNYRCFTGPYLSKGRLMLLPQSVGPGPVSLVIREVVSMLINVAYKSSRVLRELQLDGAPDPAMQQQVLGAKYVTSIYCFGIFHIHICLIVKSCQNATLFIYLIYFYLKQFTVACNFT